MDHEPKVEEAPGLRQPWSQSARAAPRRLVRPLQAFLHEEASGGILLLAAAIAALVWANSPWGDTYDTVWHTKVTFSLGDASIAKDIQHWINDGLMALFFFVVGLEIKRELATGELRELRAAALPAFGALGGMVVPALIYVALNVGGEGSRGWGIPMATDIAFAVGVLALAGPRLPQGAKLFLLALAIVDDIGAILVIAIFYSAGIEWAALAGAAGLIGLILAAQRLQVRWTPIYVALGIGVWFLVLLSGVHATIAGVALGLLTPAVAFQRPAAVSLAAKRIADDTHDAPQHPDADAHLWLSLANISREAVSPVGRLERILHPWSSFVIVPLFALANSGVRLSADALSDAFSSSVAVGIVLGLVVGKLVGISAFAWIAVRIGLARLPNGVTWRHLVPVSAIAGIGFTVSLFITTLAFPSSELLDQAKVGVLAASILAALVGTVLLRALRASRSAA